MERKKPLSQPPKPVGGTSVIPPVETEPVASKKSKAITYVVITVSILAAVLVAYLVILGSTQSEKSPTQVQETEAAFLDKSANSDLSSNPIPEPLELGETSDLGRVIRAVDFDLESHPGDDKRISIQDEKRVGNCATGCWILFRNFNLGQGAETLTVTVSSGTLRRTASVKLHVDNLETPAIASIPVEFTGSWTTPTSISAALSSNVSGKRDIYFTFESNHPNGGADLFDFRFD